MSNRVEIDSHKRKPGDFPNYFIYELSPLEYLFYLSYIYSLYNGSLSNSELVIDKMESITNYVHPIRIESKGIVLPDTGLFHFEDLLIFVDLTFNGESYNLTFKHTLSKDNHSIAHIQENDLWIQGKSKGSFSSVELEGFIKKESIFHSSLSRKVLNYIPGDDAERIDFINKVKLIDPPENSLDALFIPRSKKEQINRFIYSIKTFENNSTLPLRYLFSGKPGTGKTQIIRTIISATKGIATVLFCKGGELPLQEIFDFCSFFKPCLLIIDDVDFIAGDRYLNQNNSNLSTFMQILDGILPNNVFILASTNDKKLVDEAASRPGRFDMILDIGEIEPDNYLSLIKRETNDESILSFINEEILNEFRNKKVTGAFIVSLIKQLRSAKAMKGSLTKEDFLEYLNLSHNGFYGYNDESFNRSVGF